MKRSNAATVCDYLADLPPDRRAVLESVRQVILENLGTGYAERVQYGMIGYFVPLGLYPAGYHCDPRQPLPFAAPAAQKRYFSLYLMCPTDPSVALDRSFLEAWSKSGRKAELAKCCDRFRAASDLPLDVVAELLQRVSVEKFVAFYEASVAFRKASPDRDSSRGGQ